MIKINKVISGGSSTSTNTNINTDIELSAGTTNGLSSADAPPF